MNKKKSINVIEKDIHSKTGRAVEPEIMIVDDDEAVGNTLMAILQKAGYNARWARTGKEGLEQMARVDPNRRVDILLVDIRLPDMHGLDVLQEGRKLNPELGAIVLTGYADTETAIRALNEGAFAYVQKPYNVDAVKALLERLFERQNLLRQNRALVLELKEANASLERKVADRTRALVTANLDLVAAIEKVKESDSTKSAFVSMVSHEMRTPLTVIEGFTETLLDKLEKMKKEDVRRYLEIIHADTLRLARLVQNILDLSQMEAKAIAIQPAPFQLKPLVESVLRGLNILKEGMRFEIEFPDPELTIISDRDCVEQILLNLLSNAIKYSPDGGVIRIQGIEEEASVRINVIDSGPGISPEEQEKVFQAFYRSADAINRKTPGSGLGLTITRAIVEALGGSIGVKSLPEQTGCEFSFTLPKEILGGKVSESIHIASGKPEGGPQ